MKSLSRLAFAALVTCPALAHARSAGEIIDATGVRGGLVVHLGSGDGKLTAALRANDSYLVHGLDADAGNVDGARRHVQSLGLYGKVSVTRFDRQRLPYADNLVNLLVSEDLGRISMREVLRVLAPCGVAYVKTGGEWVKTVKPWPDDIDEWTHWLHGPDGNAVARDRVVGPPRRIQWTARPLWSRHHDSMPSISAMVSAGGRLFYIIDEGPTAVGGPDMDKWALVARDAFNGVLLWKRPMISWGWSQWAEKWSGRWNQPYDLPKHLVAVGDRVYVTLDFKGPLMALDAATGETEDVYEGTEGTDEILYHRDRLILARNEHDADTGRVSFDRKTVCLVDPKSGTVVWRKTGLTGLPRARSLSVNGLLLTAGGDAVFLVDREAIVALDFETGGGLWRRPLPVVRPEGNGPRKTAMGRDRFLLYHDGVVLFAQPYFGRAYYLTRKAVLYAFSADDGGPLWEHPFGGWPFDLPPDVFAIDGLVWVHRDVGAAREDVYKRKGVVAEVPPFAVIGIDVKTGAVRREIPTADIFQLGNHHRCYRNNATERYILTAKRGIEFTDVHSGETDKNFWVRGGCLFGIIPCNGLIYSTPHPCECHLNVKLNGFFALASSGPRATAARPDRPPPPVGKRFEEGPAYGNVRGPTARGRSSGDWPAYRHDAKRSGAASSAVSNRLKPIWRTRIGDTLSAPVIAGGRVFVAAADEHRVVSLDAAEGDAVWSFTAGARVDSPPTVHDDLVLFGCRDGWVYALRASDGKLAWRRRLAPEERLVGAMGQLESAWPIHGSVLVKDGIVYAVAGRSSFLDHGMHVYGLDVHTGDIERYQRLYSADPDTGKMKPQPLNDRTWRGNILREGALADVLSADEEHVYMREQVLFQDSVSDGSSSRDPRAGKSRLRARSGLLDDSYFNRGGWELGGRAQICVFDSETVYGVQAYESTARNEFFFPGGKGYTVFARPLGSRAPRARPTSDADASGQAPRGRGATSWSRRIAVRVQAMVLAKDALLVAGTPDVVDPEDPLAAFEGRKGAILSVLSLAGGRTLDEYGLASPPVWDGMALANGRLVVVQRDGHVLCMGSR